MRKILLLLLAVMMVAVAPAQAGKLRTVILKLTEIGTEAQSRQAGLLSATALEAALFNAGRYEVIDRQQFEKLYPKATNPSWLSDPIQIREAGRAADVNIFVTGNVVADGGQMTANIRFIDAETGDTGLSETLKLPLADLPAGMIKFVLDKVNAKFPLLGKIAQVRSNGQVILDIGSNSGLTPDQTIATVFDREYIGGSIVLDTPIGTLKVIQITPQASIAEIVGQPLQPLRVGQRLKFQAVATVLPQPMPVATPVKPATALNITRWEPFGVGLEGRSIGTLTADQTGAIYATGNGLSPLYKISSGSRVWSSVGQKQFRSPRDILPLQNGVIYLGSQDEPYSSSKESSYFSIEKYEDSSWKKQLEFDSPTGIFFFEYKDQMFSIRGDEDIYIECLSVDGCRKNSILRKPTSIFRSKNNLIYIGTEGNGVYVYDPSKDQAQAIGDGLPFAQNSALYARITGVTGDADGNLYASAGYEGPTGSDKPSGGFYKLGKNTRTWTEFSNGLPKRGIYRSVVDLNGNIYGVTLGDGVYVLPAGTTEWKPVSLNLDEKGKKAFAVIVGPDNTPIIGTEGGVFRGLP
jgi:hypothetical protein